MTTQSQTVLLVENGLLLNAAVKHLLASDERLCVVSTVFRSEDELIRQIDTCHPDVVVLTDRLMLIQRPRIRDLLASCKRLRLIVIGSEDDCIDVYDKYRLVASKANDLLEIVSSRNVESAESE